MQWLGLKSARRNTRRADRNPVGRQATSPRKHFFLSFACRSMTGSCLWLAGWAGAGPLGVSTFQYFQRSPNANYIKWRAEPSFQVASFAAATLWVEGLSAPRLSLLRLPESTAQHGDGHLAPCLAPCVEVSCQFWRADDETARFLASPAQGRSGRLAKFCFGG